MVTLAMDAGMLSSGSVAFAAGQTIDESKNSPELNTAEEKKEWQNDSYDEEMGTEETLEEGESKAQSSTTENTTETETDARDSADEESTLEKEIPTEEDAAEGTAENTTEKEPEAETVSVVAVTCMVDDTVAGVLPENVKFRYKINFIGKEDGVRTNYFELAPGETFSTELKADTEYEIMVQPLKEAVSGINKTIVLKNVEGAPFTLNEQTGVGVISVTGGDANLEVHHGLQSLKEEKSDRMITAKMDREYNGFAPSDFTSEIELVTEEMTYQAELDREGVWSGLPTEQELKGSSLVIREQSAAAELKDIGALDLVLRSATVENRKIDAQSGEILIDNYQGGTIDLVYGTKKAILSVTRRTPQRSGSEPESVVLAEYKSSGPEGELRFLLMENETKHLAVEPGEYEIIPIVSSAGSSLSKNISKIASELEKQQFLAEEGQILPISLGLTHDNADKLTIIVKDKDDNLLSGAEIWIGYRDSREVLHYLNSTSYESYTTDDSGVAVIDGAKLAGAQSNLLVLEAAPSGYKSPDRELASFTYHNADREMTDLTAVYEGVDTAVTADPTANTLTIKHNIEGTEYDHYPVKYDSLSNGMMVNGSFVFCHDQWKAYPAEDVIPYVKVSYDEETGPTLNGAKKDLVKRVLYAGFPYNAAGLSAGQMRDGVYSEDDIRKMYKEIEEVTEGLTGNEIFQALQQLGSIYVSVYGMLSDKLTPEENIQNIIDILGSNASLDTLLYDATQNAIRYVLDDINELSGAGKLIYDYAAENEVPEEADINVVFNKDETEIDFQYNPKTRRFESKILTIKTNPIHSKVTIPEFFQVHGADGEELPNVLEDVVLGTGFWLSSKEMPAGQTILVEPKAFAVPGYVEFYEPASPMHLNPSNQHKEYLFQKLIGYEQVELRKEFPFVVGDISWPEEYGTVSVTKTDAGNQEMLLDGAVFRLDGVTDKNYTQTVNTREGAAVFNNLHLGEYLLTETKAPDGYILDSKPVEIFVTDKEIVYMTITNEKEIEKPEEPEEPGNPEEPENPEEPGNSNPPTSSGRPSSPGSTGGYAENPTTQIPEEDVPLGEGPLTEIPDPDVPLTERPIDVILDTEIPTEGLPHTSDKTSAQDSGLLLVMWTICIVLVISEKKKTNDIH